MKSTVFNHRKTCSEKLVLLEIDGSYIHISKAKFKKIVYKYDIYVIKHRHLTPSICYSPLKKEEVLAAFLQHLNNVTQVI